MLVDRFRVCDLVDKLTAAADDARVARRETGQVKLHLVRPWPSPTACIQGGTSMYKLARTGFLRKTWHLASTEILTGSDFDALAKQLSVDPLLAQKIGFVAARRAATVERVETFSDGHETTNTANVGDWIVTNMTPHGVALRGSGGRFDTYVITADAFERLYEAVGRQSEFGALFSAKGAVSVIELPGSFDILAPWNERQKGKTGYLIRNGEEIYGIEKSIFHRTYDIRGPGALKLLRPGKKRILSLDGGGVRGMLTIAFLEQLEGTV